MKQKLRTADKKGSICCTKYIPYSLVTICIPIFDAHELGGHSLMKYSELWLWNFILQNVRNKVKFGILMIIGTCVTVGQWR